MAPHPETTTIFTRGRRVWNNIASVIGCCKKYRSGIGDEVVVENGFDSDMTLMDMDEIIVLDNDMVQMATGQVEEIYLSDNENEEFGEIYFSDEEDNDDAL